MSAASAAWSMPELPAVGHLLLGGGILGECGRYDGPAQAERGASDLLTVPSATTRSGSRPWIEPTGSRS